MSLVRLIQSQIVFKNLFKQQQNYLQLIQKSSLATSNELTNKDEDEDDFADPDMTPEKEEKLEKEKLFVELITKKQCVSRFSTKNAENKFHCKLPMLPPNSLALGNKKFFRKIYARHGSESNVDPRVCWPSRDELQEIIDDEKNYDFSLKHKIDTIAKMKYDEANNVSEKIKETREALNKMPAQIEDYYKRIQKKDLLDEQKGKRKAEMLAIAREYYGYNIDYRDPKVQLMVEKLQKEKKDEEKSKKKAGAKLKQ